MDIKFKRVNSSENISDINLSDKKSAILESLNQPSYLSKADNTRIAPNQNLLSKNVDLDKKLIDIQNQLKDNKPVDGAKFFKSEADVTINKLPLLGQIPEEDAYSVTSSVMSLVPGLSTIKLAINVASSGRTMTLIKDDVKQGDIGGTVSDGVTLAKTSWSSVFGTSKIVHAVAKKGLDRAIVSEKMYSKIESMNNRSVRIASIIEMPFAVAGTSISYLKTVQENSKLNEKKQELETLIKNNPENIKEREKLEDEVSTLKINRNLKLTSSIFSTISTVTLGVSIKKPDVKGISMAAVSLGTSVASSITSFLSNDKTRDELKRKVGLD